MTKILIDRAVLEQALEALNASMPHNNDMDEDWSSHIAARRALRAALEQPQDHPEQHLDMVPTGWKLVPVELSPDMLDAGRNACEGRFYPQDMLHGPRAMMADHWAAMINASPQSPVVEQPLKDQLVDWPEVDRLLKTVKYLIGIAERGTVRKMRDDETVEQFVLSYVQALEQQQCEAFCFCDNDISLQSVSGGGASEGLYGRITLKIGSEFVSYVKEQPQVEHGPVASIYIADNGEREFDDWRHDLPVGRNYLYTHPQNLNCKSTQARLATLWGYEKPQPPRQPLTEDGITQAFLTTGLFGPGDEVIGYEVEMVRAIERAHGIGGEV